jgi:hypothetical protein
VERCRAGKARVGRISRLIRNRGATPPPAHFDRNPPGRGQWTVFRRCSLDPYKFRYGRFARALKNSPLALAKAMLFMGQDTRSKVVNYVLVKRDRTKSTLDDVTIDRGSATLRPWTLYVPGRQSLCTHFRDDPGPRPTSLEPDESDSVSTNVRVPSDLTPPRRPECRCGCGQSQSRDGGVQLRARSKAPGLNSFCC